MALALFSKQTSGFLIGLLGLAILAVGYRMMQKRSQKRSFVVRIGSASGEANALRGDDREYIQKIVDAVNQAIIERR